MTKKLKAPRNSAEKEIEVKFYDTAFYLFKTKDITNYLANKNTFTSKFGCVFDKIIKEISSKKFSEIINNGHCYHCHKISNEKGKLDIYKRAVREIAKKMFKDYKKYEQTIEQLFFDSENIYQIGVQGIDELRLIGIFDNNVFGVVFIDFYHLTYSSNKYNSTDYFSYNYDPFIHIREDIHE